MPKRFIPNEKRIGLDWFYLSKSFHLKPKAKKLAKRFRKDGAQARVLKVSDKYAVYYKYPEKYG